MVTAEDHIGQAYQILGSLGELLQEAPMILDRVQELKAGLGRRASGGERSGCWGKSWRGCTSSEAQPACVPMPTLPLLAVRPWSNHFTSLNPTFFTCKSPHPLRLFGFLSGRVKFSVQRLAYGNEQRRTKGWIVKPFDSRSQFLFVF